MKFQNELVINKPINEAWQVLGPQFGQAQKWASGVYHSNSYGEPIKEGATCSNRSCETSFGKITENLNIMDNENYILEYEVVEGFPFFVETAINNWSLTKMGNKTKVTMKTEVRTKGVFGAIMTPMMKMQMGGLLKNAIDDFKIYLETGDISDRKKKENAKMAKKAA